MFGSSAMDSLRAVQDGLLDGSGDGSQLVVQVRNLEDRSEERESAAAGWVTRDLGHVCYGTWVG